MTWPSTRYHITRLLLCLSSVGVTGSLLQWFRSYLSDHSQDLAILFPSFCQIRSTTGFHTWPSTFHVNSLAKLDLSPATSIILYTDDILCISSSNDSALLQHNVDTISSWIVSSGLATNPTKSTLTKPQVFRHINSPCSNSVKYLGVTFTSDGSRTLLCGRKVAPLAQNSGLKEKAC